MPKKKAPITWSNGKRRLGDLVPWEKNPRQITEKDQANLTESLRKFGIVYPPLVGPKNQIYDGHQRNKVLELMSEFSEDTEIDVRISSRALTAKERKELTIRLHENTGGWDFDAVGELYTPEDLEGWGFSPDLMPAFEGWDTAFGDIKEGDKDPFTTKTFTLHSSQAKTVEEAIALAQLIGKFKKSPNKNNNGNALAQICLLFLKDYGGER